MFNQIGLLFTYHICHLFHMYLNIYTMTLTFTPNLQKNMWTFQAIFSGKDSDRYFLLTYNENKSSTHSVPFLVQK